MGQTSELQSVEGPRDQYHPEYVKPLHVVSPVYTIKPKNQMKEDRDGNILTGSDCLLDQMVELH